MHRGTPSFEWAPWVPIEDEYVDDSEQVLTIAKHAEEEPLFLEDETAETIENRMDDIEVDVSAVQENNLIQADNAGLPIVEEGLIIVTEDSIFSEEEDFVGDEEENQDDYEDG